MESIDRTDEYQIDSSLNQYSQSNEAELNTSKSDEKDHF